MSLLIRVRRVLTRDVRTYSRVRLFLRDAATSVVQPVLDVDLPARDIAYRVETEEEGARGDL